VSTRDAKHNLFMTMNLSVSPTLQIVGLHVRDIPPIRTSLLLGTVILHRGVKMTKLKWDELYINDILYIYDPVNEEWFYSQSDRFGGPPVNEEVNDLLNYIQTIQLPKQSSESLKFMIDELKKTIEYKNLEIEKLREQIGFYK
jgi:hypothetical protein